MSMKHAARHTIPRHILPPRLLRERVWLFMFVPYKTTTVKPVGLLGGVASEGTGGGSEGPQAGRRHHPALGEGLLTGQSLWRRTGG